MGGNVDETIRVVIIDDHPVVRAGVCAWLTVPGSGIEVIATGDRLAVAHAKPGNTADVLVLDLALADGVEVGPRTVEQLALAGRRVVILSQYVDSQKVPRLLEAGALAVLSKDEGPHRCLAAVRAAARGHAYLGRTSARGLATDERPDRPSLSARESETLRLYSYGWPREAVAETMGISVNTVLTNLKRVAEKYADVGRHASQRHGYMVRALEDGIVTLAELGTQMETGHSSAAPN